MTEPIELITPPPEARPSSARWRCPCGFFPTDDARHSRAHLTWALGVPVPPSLPWPDKTIAVIRPTSPAPWRHAASKLARVAQRDGGYDFPSFPTLLGRGYDDEVHTRAFCYRSGATAVGYLALGDIPTHGQYDFIQTEIPRGEDNRLRPNVMLVFTALHWRRRGIARALVAAAAEHAGVGLDGLAWTTPFTPTGMALAQSCADPAGRVWVG